MAKDKGAKASKSKSTKPAKSSSDDAFAKPSEAPAGGDGWKFATDENLGKLFLITPLRVDRAEDTFSKEPGATKEVIVCDIVELNEKKPAKSEEHLEAWVFGGYLRGSLRGYVGERKVLGRLAQGKPDRGNIPWILEDADSDDVEIAKEYLASVDPFATKGGKGAKADEPAKGKGKKKK